MKRFYIRVIDNYATVYYRPLHQFIEFLPDAKCKEGKKRVQELMSMSIEDFYSYLATKGIMPKKSFLKMANPNEEDWYESAWLMCTKSYFSYHNLDIKKIPEEDIPFDYIAKLAQGQKKGWSIRKVKPLKVKKHNDTKEELQELQEKYDKGALTKREYNEAKSQYLDSDLEEKPKLKKLTKVLED